MRSTDFHFDNTIGGFVSSGDINNPWLVLDRSAQVNSSSSETPVYWLAWEVDDNNKPITDVTKLKKVVWDAKDQAWYQWDAAINDWAYSNGKKLKWIISSRKFE